MDAKDKLYEMRQANYEAAIDNIQDAYNRALTGAQEADAEGNQLGALLLLQVGTLDLLSYIAASLASIQWMGVRDFDA